MPFILATSINFLQDYFKDTHDTHNIPSTIESEMNSVNESDRRKCEQNNESNRNRLKYVVELNPETNEPWINLESVIAVFETLGFEQVRLPSITTEGIHYDWDIMWTWAHYEDAIYVNVSRLELYQKINHFPGIGCLTRKDYLSTNTMSKYIPRGFSNFHDLKDYAEANPEKKFVEKLSSNEGIKLKSYKDIRFDDDGDGSNYFAQEFVENPLLIDGHMWDFGIFCVVKFLLLDLLALTLLIIGIYVVITSVDPLRVYYYTENCVIRFGKLPYVHDNFTDEDTYVVDSDKTFGQVFPAFHDYRNFSFTQMITLTSNLKKLGVSPQHIMEQVEDCIASVVASNENYIMDQVRESEATYGKYHFFELLRFDFIVDDESNIHLLEANLSPNIAQLDSDYFYHKNMYRALIRNVLDMVGIGPTSYHTLLKDEERAHELLDYLSYERFIATSPEDCMSEACQSGCELEKCQLCIKCLDKNFKFDLRVAFMEHMHSGCFKRAYPRSDVS